jgi:hypothetical protein
MNRQDVKEDFCPSCLVVPMAFAGAGATAIGGNISSERKRTKKMLVISGIVTLFTALAVGGYYLIFKKDCTSCKA